MWKSRTSKQQGYFEHKKSLAALFRTLNVKTNGILRVEINYRSILEMKKNAHIINSNKAKGLVALLQFLALSGQENFT